MCCVGTKNLIADYAYVVDRFIELKARTPQTAVTFKDLNYDFSEHLFARDNWQSLIRCGDIVAFNGGYYLARLRKSEEVSCCAPKAFSFFGLSKKVAG